MLLTYFLKPFFSVIIRRKITDVALVPVTLGETGVLSQQPQRQVLELSLRSSGDQRGHFSSREQSAKEPGSSWALSDTSRSFPVLIPYPSGRPKQNPLRGDGYQLGTKSP